MPSELNMQSPMTIWEDLLSVLKRRKLTVLAVFLGVVVLNLLTDRYEVESHLLVKLGRENTEVPITVEKGGLVTTGVQKEEINSYIQLLKSPSLIETVVDQIGLEAFAWEPTKPSTLLGRMRFHIKHAVRWGKRQISEALIALNLDTELTDRQQAVKLVADSLDVRPERDSNVIRVSLRLPDASLARRIVETMLDTYLKRHVEIRRDANIREIFDNQTVAYREQLEDLQQVRSRIRDEWNISSVPVQRAELLQRLQLLEKEIDENESRKAMLESQQQMLQSLLENLPTTSARTEVIEPNPAIQSIKERLVELKLQRIETVGRYAEDMELVKTIDSEIASLEGLLRSEKTTQAGQITYEPHPLTNEFEMQIERIKVELAGLEAFLEEDRKHVAVIKDELWRLNVGEDKLRMAELEHQVVEQKYLTNANRREEARIAEELDVRRVANIAILSPPTSTAQPVYPRKKLVMLMGILAGLIAGVGWALLVEWRTDTVNGPGDLANVDGLPFLGIFRVEQAAIVGLGLGDRGAA